MKTFINYAITSNNNKKINMTQIKPNSFYVKGERCSGTNYLEKLIEENLSVKIYEAEWKHSYINLGITDKIDNPIINHLTIFIFRNVFDWLRSFYMAPHHLEGAESAHWVNQPTFGEFIRREVKVVDNDNQIRNIDRHPYTLENPKDLLQLRKWKIENWLNYKKLGKPAHYVKYEDLAKNPEKIIREINDLWFHVNFSFKNWIYHKKDKKVKYEPKKYFKIGNNDFAYIIENVDWNLEKQIGYKPNEGNTHQIRNYK